MKRMLIICLLLALMLAALPAVAYAAAPAEFGRNYMDKNNDGICDNAGSGSCYVDLDEDGVCDNAADKVCENKGSMCGMGAQQMAGCGRGAMACGAGLGYGCRYRNMQ